MECPPDGTGLADVTHHVVFAPRDAAPTGAPSAAILEYIPYRKSDGTLARDHRYLMRVASHGYVCARVDMRGAGDSEGVYFGEYLPQEQSDACDIIAWLAAQPWCSGLACTARAGAASTACRWRSTSQPPSKQSYHCTVQVGNLTRWQHHPATLKAVVSLYSSGKKPNQVAAPPANHPESSCVTVQFR